MNELRKVITKIGFTKNTLKRAGRTFIQTAISYVAVNLVAIDFTTSKEAIKSALIGLLVSAIAAGISAAMNLEKNNESED